MSFLIRGLTLGFAAGISPGPLFTLVVTASLRRGLAGGLRVALAPLITDLPIVLGAVLILNQVPDWALRALTVVGGFVVIYIGVEILTSARTATLTGETRAPERVNSELWRGVAVNVFNPHPYIFWVTIGGPALVAGWQESSLYSFTFLISFYLLLVGSKMVVAWLVARQAKALSLTWYRRVLMICGIAMMGLGLSLLASTYLS